MEESPIYTSCTEIDTPKTAYYASDLAEITFSDEPINTEES